MHVVTQIQDRIEEIQVDHHVGPLGRILPGPETQSTIFRCVRASLPRVLYAVEKEDISVVAVMNLHRYPEYWKERSVK